MYSLDVRPLPRPILDPGQVEVVATRLGCSVGVVRAVARFSYALGEEPIPSDLPEGIDPNAGSASLRTALGDDGPFLFAWTPPPPEVRLGAFGLPVPTARTAAAEALLDAIALEQMLSDGGFNPWDQQNASAAVYAALEAFLGQRDERTLPAAALELRRPPWWQEEATEPEAIALLDPQTLFVRAGRDVRLVALPSSSSENTHLRETAVTGGREAGRRVADNPTAVLFRALPGGLVLFVDREEAALSLLDTATGEWLGASPISLPPFPFAPYKSDRWELWDPRRGSVVRGRSVDNRRSGALFDDHHFWIEGDTAIVDIATGAIEYLVQRNEDEDEDEDESPQRPIAFSAASQCILRASGELWQGDRCLRTWPPPRCAAFSTDGRRLVLATTTAFTVVDL